MTLKQFGDADHEPHEITRAQWVDLQPKEPQIVVDGNVLVYRSRNWYKFVKPVKPKPKRKDKAPAKQESSVVKSGALSTSELRGMSEMTLSGNTYEYRDEIKRFGGKWDKITKTWKVPVNDTMRGRDEQSSFMYRLSKRGVIFETR